MSIAIILPEITAVTFHRQVAVARGVHKSSSNAGERNDEEPQ